MKNLWRRLHLANSLEDPPDGAHPSSPKSKYSLSDSPGLSSSPTTTDFKPFSGFSGLLSVAKHALSQAENLKQKAEGSVDVEQERRAAKEDICDQASLVSTRHDGGGDRQTGTAETCGEAEERADSATSPYSSPTSWAGMQHKSLAFTSSDSTLLAVDTLLKGTPGIQRTQTAEASDLQLASDQAVLFQDEELQVRVAMALSVRDDPEAASIETFKDANRGSHSLLSRPTATQLLADRYWKYGALSYKDKILDGFYDVYAGFSNASAERLPSLTMLQKASISKVTWEAVVVNRAADPDLVRLEQKAIAMASKAGSTATSVSNRGVINGIAKMVADQMGGPSVNAELLFENWKSHSTARRQSAGSVVLPLGKLDVGLGRHRALLFKVLADAVGIPCQLVKGKRYALNDEAAFNVLKDESEREYIIDLMAVPGSILPYHTLLTGKDSSILRNNQDKGEKAFLVENDGKQAEELAPPSPGITQPVQEVCAVFTQPSCKPVMLRRSPSWTEGVGLQGTRQAKVKDVSEYMINAAKDNPFLAQKLHAVLIESGVDAPPGLFTEKSRKQLQDQMSEELNIDDELQKIRASKGDGIRQKQKSSMGPGRPGFAVQAQSSSLDEGRKEKLLKLNSVEGLGDRHPLDLSFLNVSPGSSPNSSASSGPAIVQSTSPVLPTAALSLIRETLPSDLIKGPVAAAAATAAVVASSMLAAATKSESISDTSLDVPVAVAATATAAVVAAATAVGRRIELPLLELMKEGSEKGGGDLAEYKNDEGKDVQQNSEDSDAEGRASGYADKHAEDERVSDRSTGSLSVKSDGRLLDDVAECEILWEDLVIGERIGLGSYGEVYRGDWNGTEVAVKKFLDQDISGDALLEFASELRLMKRMRHPNVVLFLGAVMHPPNLSIVTEFLPRGSLYRLIHRSNGQLDERRRLRMALDVARGMNYLHNCAPAIVHRDLKSPNLLVDKNWVVKVCDFGLSRIKQNTFLSSKSTAGTAEWMAPEVLRNEPSNEKCDVYSFGVILWELATLQQPWASMNPMQVVGAVGFQHRNLEIPDNLDPVIVSIIQECWHRNPSRRPSFLEIMNTLKPLQKPITPATSRKL